MLRLSDHCDEERSRSSNTRKPFVVNSNVVVIELNC